MKIKEVSHYRLEDAEGNIIKKRFKDLHDAHEKGVNFLLKKEDADKVIIKAEIQLIKKADC